MDPKQLREALDNEGALWATGNPHVGRLWEAAKEWVDLFEECENCGGTGKRPSYSEGIFATRDFFPCSACDGRGFSLNRERYTRATGQNTIEAAISAFLFGDSTETRQEGT